MSHFCTPLGDCFWNNHPSTRKTYFTVTALCTFFCIRSPVVAVTAILFSNHFNFGSQSAPYIPILRGSLLFQYFSVSCRIVEIIEIKVSTDTKWVKKAVVLYGNEEKRKKWSRLSKTIYNFSWFQISSHRFTQNYQIR